MPKNERTFALSQRLQELIEKKQDEDITLSQTQQAKQMNIPHQNFAKYVNNEAECSISTVCKMARYYGLTTDYLLGLTDIKTSDTKIKDICEYTGLSEEAIRQLELWSKGSGRLTETLNTLLNNSYFCLFLVELMNLSIHSSEVIKNVDIDKFDESEVHKRNQDSDLCRYRISEFISNVMNECFDNRKIHKDAYDQIFDKILDLHQILFTQK